MSLNSSSSSSSPSAIRNDNHTVNGTPFEDNDIIMDTSFNTLSHSHHDLSTAVLNGISSQTSPPPPPAVVVGGGGSCGDNSMEGPMVASAPAAAPAVAPRRGLSKDEVLLRVLGPSTSSVVSSTLPSPPPPPPAEDNVNTKELAAATALRTEALLARESTTTTPLTRIKQPIVLNKDGSDNKPIVGHHPSLPTTHYEHVISGRRNLYTIPKTGSVLSSSGGGIVPRHHHSSTLPPGGYQVSGLSVAASKFPPGTFIATTRQQQQAATTPTTATTVGPTLPPPPPPRPPAPGGGGLPTFLSSPSAYDAMYTAAMLRQQQHSSSGRVGNTIIIGKHKQQQQPTPLDNTNTKQQQQHEEQPHDSTSTGIKEASVAKTSGVKRPLDSDDATTTTVPMIKQQEEGGSTVKIAAPTAVPKTNVMEQTKKANTKTKGISPTSSHGVPLLPTTPQSAPKRRRLSAKAKTAAAAAAGGGGGGDVKNGKGGNGDISGSGMMIRVKTKGIQVGTQQQDINGEVTLLSKPKHPVMSPPLRWQSSHQMPPHSLEDAFEVWSFCCNYCESLLDIKSVTAGEYADALFARGLSPLMQEIHLALLRIVIPHIVSLSSSSSSRSATNGMSIISYPLLGYLPLNISSKTLTLGWQYLTSEVVLAYLSNNNTTTDGTTQCDEINEAGKWFNMVEYKDIPPRVRITVLKALLQSCQISPLFIRYQSCVSAALAKAKIYMGRLAKIENESMQKEADIGRNILIAGIESRRQELNEMESRLRALNMWAKFGTTSIITTDEEEEEEEEEEEVEKGDKDIKDEIEGGTGDMSSSSSSLLPSSSSSSLLLTLEKDIMPSTAMVALYSDNIKHELNVLDNRRIIVSGVRQQATRALLKVAPDNITGKPTPIGIDRAGNSYYIIPQYNNTTTSSCICVRYHNGSLGFYQTQSDIEGLISTLDKETSRPEGKLRHHILEATAKDLNIRQNRYPPDLRTTEGITSLTSAGELNNIIHSLRKESNRLLDLTVKMRPIADVSDSYITLKTVVKQQQGEEGALELPNTLTAGALLSAETALGDKVKWLSKDERNAFLHVLGNNNNNGDECGCCSGSSSDSWWNRYENGCNNEGIDKIVKPLTEAELKELGNTNTKGLDKSSPVIPSAPMIRWDVLGSSPSIKSEYNTSSIAGSTPNSVKTTATKKNSNTLHECKSCGRIFKSQGGLTQHTNRGCKGPTATSSSIHHNNTSPSSDTASITTTPVEPYPLAPHKEEGGPSSPLVMMCLGWLLERIEVST